MLNRLLIIISLLVTGNLLASTTLTAIEEAFERGELTQDERILNKVYAMLEPELLDPRFQEIEIGTIKCGTPILIEYEALQPQLSQTTIDIIEGLLLPSVDGLRETFFSPGGHFSFNYATTGIDAVPATDSDASGVPDFVEWAATYLDYTWAQEVDSAGFAGPNHAGGDGFYNVSFESMGPYGYCTTSGLDVGATELTRLVLHNSYVGFGANQDPEGNVKGAMKVTCAHEFKHASQRSESSWSEDGWVELDATWAEEFVYDYVNDSMLNFMGSGDPYSHPHWGLDHGGTGSYEDYAWEDFMHQRFDANSYTTAPILEYFWDWRQTHTTQNVMTSYAQALTQYGSSLPEAFAEYVVWNFFTGSRAVIVDGISQFGYDDAGVNGYPTATLTSTHNSYPVSSSVTGIENLGSRMIRLNTSNQLGLEIEFDGQDGVEMSAMWAIRQDDNTVDWGSIDLDGSNDGSIVLDVRDATMAALIPVVTQITGTTYGASYSIELNSLAECDPGDIDDSGIIDVTDLVRLVAIILGNGAPANDVELCAADVNDDGQPNIQDVITLVDLILQ
ncbi:MAG: hypothetical protein HOB84_11905 [Candidatus Marinimicrobia bacterium]|nr:hypothetical protein [Candidatus Neomarinimicrobiota bacterium]MBT4715466.1 hypothetical protein [Candidatus Neomarinimicrobiota bacterium]